MRSAACLLLFLFAFDAFAATTWRWPDAASCNDTLQACLDAAANGDTVLVATNGTVDVANGQLTISKPLRLLAASGYRPTISGASIYLGYDPGSTASWSAKIDGFRITGGGVAISGLGGTPSIDLEHLDIARNQYAAIAYFGSSVGANRLTIANSRLQSSGAAQEAIEYFEGRDATISIHDNRLVHTQTSFNYGIYVYPSGTSTLSIYSNQIVGSCTEGVFVYPQTDNVATKMYLVSNFIDCEGGIGDIDDVAPPSGTSDAQVFNNTLIGSGTGFILSNANTPTGRLTNNVLADNTYCYAAVGPGFTNDHNLITGTCGQSGAMIPGPGTVNADPQFLHGKANARLSATSPAIGAGNSADLRSLLASAGIPEIDADGSRRFKGIGNVVDMGAFELGDVGIVAQTPTLDDPALNHNPNVQPILMQNGAPDGVPIFYSPQLTGIAFDGTRYNLVGGDGAAAAGAYNAFAPAAGDGSFAYMSTSADIIDFQTHIDNSYINGHPNRLVMATLREPPPFNHPFSTVYLFGAWFVLQTDASGSDPPFPTGVSFDIYAQDASFTMFDWIASGGEGNFASIHHPLLDAEPCARVYATGADALYPYPTVVTYDGLWNIAGQSGDTIPAGTTFHIFIDEAATDECRYDHIFRDGFDGPLPN